jgi:hypothetical protein
MMAFIPLHKGTKKPAWVNWNQRENCIFEFEEYHKLEGYDLALADAFCEPPVGCLDIDNYELAHPILMTLGFDSEVADTTTFTSGRSNSRKHFMALPEPLTTFQVIIDGVAAFEYRCQNENGTTVADKFSGTHPSGTVYAWENGLDMSCIQPMPECLLNDWKRRLDDKRAAKQAIVCAKASSYVLDCPNEVALLRRKLAYISPDSDRDTWFKVVFSILATGLSDAVAIAEDWSRGSSKFNQRDFNSTVASFKPNGGIGVGTLHHFAVRGGYRG